MKTNNIICPIDELECTIIYEDCRNCPRYKNGVRATGGMPLAESIYKWVKSLIKK